MLKQMQHDLLASARERMNTMWYKEAKLADFAQQLEERPGFYQTGWCGNPACEKQLKEHNASIRVLLEEKTFSSCFCCSDKNMTDILVAKSY